MARYCVLTIHGQLLTKAPENVDKGNMGSEEHPQRLSKLMAQRGLCSRREADEYISRGLVFVDGVKIDTLGTKVLPHQAIVLAESAREDKPALVTILLNKPTGE